MKVVEGWKERLGEDWERTYAVSNTLYVARQNNILFTVLAQFMGTEAMGDRLLLIETPEFETTPEKMLDVLGPHRRRPGLGMVFFRDYFLMDVELLGGGGRKAIEHETTKRGLSPCCRRWRRSAPTTGPGRPTRRRGRALPGSRTSIGAIWGGYSSRSRDPSPALRAPSPGGGGKTQTPCVLRKRRRTRLRRFRKVRIAGR